MEEAQFDLVIVGLGYVGLPLAQEATRAGLRVGGFDINPSVVQLLNNGCSHIDDLSDGDIREMLDGGFVASTDPGILATADAVTISVPTPLSVEGGPDLGALKAAARTVASQLRPGHLVVVESTTYPGSTEEDVLPILGKSGLQLGTDFWLAFSPERVDPGNARFGIKNTPKVVGGATPESTDKAVALYSRFIDTVVPATGTREAEMAKLLENTYRHVNIALVNEMAKFSHELGVDIWDVIRCASTKPFGFQPFYPGPGVGGHCIPIDPNYLSFKVHAELGYRFRLVELAQEINGGMPSYVVQRASALLNDVCKPLKDSRVLIVGVTYKKDIADQRESPAVAVAQALVSRGAKLAYSDPHVPEWVLPDRTLRSEGDPVAAAKTADLTILLQNHSSVDAEQIADAAQLFFDTRGVVHERRATAL